MKSERHIEHQEHATPDAPVTQGRVPCLDGLRGLAILLVMFSHFAIANPPTGHWVNQFLSRLLRSGWIGVDLFFVLSGFLITGILCDARGSANYFRNFYMRRVLRIFPLYYASLFVLVVLLPAAVYPRPGIVQMQADSIWYWSYMANVRIASAGWPPSPEYLGHFWSLAVEEQFYLFWPLLVFALRRRTMIRCCGVLLVAALVVRVALHSAGEATAAVVLTPARLDALAIGGLVALLAREEGGLRRVAGFARTIGLTGAAVVVGLYVVYGRFPGEALLVGTFGYTALACLFASVMVAALLAPATSRLARLWSSRPLVFFGKYSYALYVVHPAVIYFWPAAFSASALQMITARWIIAFGISSLLMLIVCLSVALLSWHALEKHFLRLRSRFAEPATATASDAAFSPRNGRSAILPARR